MVPRSRSQPPPPTCPLCGTSHVEVTGREGINDQLTMLQCQVCERKWSEVIPQESSEAEEPV
jgi:hypothetical protein